MNTFDEISGFRKKSDMSFLRCGRLEKQQPRGFALVATISVMVLLVMVALAMLSLATIESRGISQGAYMAEAQSNARMSMMLALGELQKSMGPDKSVNALSQILSNPSSSSSPISNPWLTGVWQSRNEDLGQQPDYSRENSFKRWLVSGQDFSELENVNFATSGSFSDPIALVGEYTAGTSNTQQHVRAGKIKIAEGKGAWWIGDQGSKALALPRDQKERDGSMTVADHLVGFATPGAHGMKSLDELKSLETNSDKSDRVLTNGQLAYYTANTTSSDSRPFFHDLTSRSQSVICNVRKGGLRKDLNLFLERDDINWQSTWPISGGPKGPLGPNDEIALSPPSEYDVLSWKHLHHHYHSQRMVNYVGGRPQLRHIRANAGVDVINNPAWNSGVTRPAIVPIRVQVFLAFGSVKDKDDPTKYYLRLYVYPVITLWNPYNVDLRVDGYHILLNTLPLKHRILVDGVEQQLYGWSIGTNNENGSGTVLSVKNVIFKAGESRVFSPVSWGPEPGGTNTHYYHDMQPIEHDYSPSKPGSKWGEGDKGVLDPRLIVSGNATNKVKIVTSANNFDDGDGAFRFLQTTFGWRGQDLYSGDGSYWTYLWSSKVGWRHEMGNPRPDDFSTNNSSQDTFGNLLNAPRPFCVVDARLKATDEEKLPNKTWCHTIPAHSYAAATSMKEGGDSHTSYYSHAYAVDFKQIDSYEQAGEYVQRVPGEADHGYFGTSYDPSGQTYITGRELPLVPLTSIAQLQNLPQHPIDAMNWSGHGLQNNAIANSFASPSIESNRVKTAATSYYLNGYINKLGGWLNGAKLDLDSFVSGTSHVDRSYAANHLLWDEYFFSSMAAQDGSFYQNNGNSRGLRTVVEKFYSKDDHVPLPNARYIPYTVGASNTEIINSIVTQSGNPTAEGYKKSAARLMITGGFNINSTSEVAWANLIASAHLKRPVVLESKSSGQPSMDPQGKFIVSRYTMPNGAMTSVGKEDMRWRSYRELTQEEINQLAKAIVIQVKTRGPFRSLGEFINRRLAGSSDDVSLYGALQAALEDPNVDINKDYRDETIVAADIPDADYKFPEAAYGSRYQGAPAYITQADILQPIAPIISARSDTFMIRAYGEALSQDGSKVLARAWCEATVQRYPEYLDLQDAPEVEHSALTSEINKQFGRRFRITAFRWLSKDEV